MKEGKETKLVTGAVDYEMSAGAVRIRSDVQEVIDRHHGENAKMLRRLADEMDLYIGEALMQGEIEPDGEEVTVLWDFLLWTAIGWLEP